MTCKHLLNGAPDCVFCHRDQLKQDNERLREALQNISVYDPGQFRPLEDEIAIWRLATEALKESSREPQSGPTNEKA